MLPQTKKRFDEFTFETYSDRYMGAGPPYQFLYHLLDRFAPSVHSLIEVGCGANCPAYRHLRRRGTAPLAACLVEPSKACAELSELRRDVAEGSSLDIRNVPLSDAALAALGPFDLCVSNRMLHEWRLYDLAAARAWDLPRALRLLASFVRPGGLVVVADFCFCEAFRARAADDAELAADMRRLEARIGHTHPPGEYLLLADVRAAAEALGLRVLHAETLAKPEPDTAREFWACVLRRAE
eukprot:gnl/Chilomastix_cuspidata/6539.p2 GENE.gnl/Chilomastix_cuspidata/6539~~gnl/Chilomastix_cuspidata/6539.p2  ORF type:complete len:240 (+),score=121.60 gnl/Chilomastix_cuspidata/6539:149-868(+)